MSNPARVAWLVALWLTPVCTVGWMGLGLSVVPAAALGLLAAAFAALGAAPAIAGAICPVVCGRQWAAIVALAIALAAIGQIARLSVFMADPTQRAFSMRPDDPWRVRHCCLTAYTEAARFAGDRSKNIYDLALYQPRDIGPLQVDAYHYPPPFLLLPRAFAAITSDFVHQRALWFAFQAIVLLAIVIGIGVWIGGLAGGDTILGGVLVLAMPYTLEALQSGNLQITAIPASVAAFLAIWAGREKSGALALAYTTASKIFPVVLVVYLVAARRWRALAWCAIAGALLLALSLVMFGTAPFEHFVVDEVPAISNGRAFPQSEVPRVQAGNTSVYGLTVRARALGLDALDARRGLAITSVYGFMLLAFVAWLAWRITPDLTTPEGRLRFAQLTLALVTLASFRSPFVGGIYGLASTLWLIALITARSTSARSFGVSVVTLVMAGAAVFWLMPTPGAGVPPRFLVAASGLVVLAAIVVNAAVAARALQWPQADAKG